MKRGVNEELKREILNATESSCVPHVDRRTLLEWNFFPQLWPGWLLSSDDSVPSFPITLSFFLVPLLLSASLELPFFFGMLFEDNGAWAPFGWPAQYFYPAIGTIAVLVTVISIILMITVTVMDPGVLLPVWPINIRKSVPRKMHKHAITVRPSGKTVFCKWCWTCAIWRPIRSVHCDACRNCVRKFDHHCPWISKCVGLRNHFVFLIWVYSASVSNLCFLFVHVFCIIGVLTSGTSTLGEFFIKYIPAYFLPFGQAPFLAFTSYLAGYYTWLGLTNQTTNERYKQLDRPYTHDSAWLNFKEFMSGVLQPSVLYSKDKRAVLSGQDIELTTAVLNQLQVKDAFGKPVEYKTGLSSNCFLLPADLADVLDEREAAYRRGHDQRITYELAWEERERERERKRAQGFCSAGAAPPPVSPQRRPQSPVSPKKSPAYHQPQQVQPHMNTMTTTNASSPGYVRSYYNPQTNTQQQMSPAGMRQPQYVAPQQTMNTSSFYQHQHQRPTIVNGSTIVNQGKPYIFTSSGQQVIQSGYQVPTYYQGGVPGTNLQVVTLNGTRK